MIAIIIYYGIVLLCVFFIWLGSVLTTFPGAKDLITGIFLIILGLSGFFWMIRNIFIGKPKPIKNLNIGDRVIILTKIEDHSDIRSDGWLYVLEMDSGAKMLFKDKHSYDKDQSYKFLWDGKKLKPCY